MIAFPRGNGVGPAVLEVGRSDQDTSYDGGLIIASGAIQSIVSSTMLALHKMLIEADTSSGVLTITLLDVAPTKSCVGILDVGFTGSFQTNKCTVQRETTCTINGSAASVDLTDANGIWWFYKQATTRWILMGGRP